MTAERRIDAHLRAWVRATAGLPGGELHSDGDALWSATGIPWPMFNGGIGGSPEEIRRCVAALREHGQPFFWWVPEGTPPAVTDALAAGGLEAFDDRAPWEEAERAALPVPQAPSGVTLEEVVDEAGHRLWAATLRAAYGFPEQGERSWLEPGRLCGWAGLPWRQWVARVDGEPAGVTLLFEGGGVAGLLGVGTVEHLRRRGVGRLLTLVPLHAGCEPVAGFFSTPDGGKLYRTLGFRATSALSRWLWMPGAGIPDSARGLSAATQ